ncbi:ATP-grasp domain-containing protein [Variovorax sp. dw_954]|uniref:ATP-grasp domain-containing protein n=1 Tax=Variovorax sp. dw_954 TaxID=2720078 RepID=UPI001BD534E9|nr:ATP-grasp domain-containing protein [Variovorax sp. dw_954]
MKNVLVLSAGRRVELVNAFKIELGSRISAAKVLATDLYPNRSAACQVADIALKAPRVSDPTYIDFLLDACEVNSVGLIVSTIDTELLLLACNREKFLSRGVHLVVSDQTLVEKCRDKRLTAKLFSDIKIDSPKIYSNGALTFPCFAKPYDGSCSVGAVAVREPNAITAAMQSDPKLMYMELIDDSHTEFTIDAYYTKYGELACFVPRERIEVRGGEISKGITRRNYVYDYLLPRMRKLQGARGCITLQIFANEKTRRFAALEINPRFGGGYPLSYSAGANYPGWLIDEYLLDRDVRFFDKWEQDLMMLRYDAKILVRGA